MKIRSGFVSNSSSSSFVIAYKLQDPCEHCGRGDTNIFSAYESRHDRYSDDTYVRAKGLSDILESLKGWYGIDSDDDDYLAKLSPKDYKDHLEYKKDQLERFMGVSSRISKQVDKGYEIIWMNVSYSDEEVFRELLGTMGDAKIVEDWG